MIYEYQGKKPQMHESVFVAEYSTIIGDVSIDSGSSIWFNSTLRGDDGGPIIIGKNVNIQEGSLLHGPGVTIEDNVTIGHQCIIHGATVKEGALVGMGATVLDGAVIGERAFVAAGSLVTPNMIVPPGMMVMGSPAKVVKEVSDELAKYIVEGNQGYKEKAQIYKEMQASRQ